MKSRTFFSKEYYKKKSKKFSNNQYLNRYRADVASQYGEDGIIKKIFKVIGTKNKQCVEFGAWDGKKFSNTYNLIMNHGWSGVLIEGNPTRFKDLIKNYKNNKKTMCINKYVGSNSNQNLDHILIDTPIKKDFDFLSIDVDSIDYHIFRAFVKFKPRVVVIEFNPCIPSTIKFIQANDSNVHQGTSILSMTELAIKKGCKLICINAENAFYVRKNLYKKFKIKNNSISALKCYKEPLSVYQLFDGTLKFDGEACLFWYGLPVDFNKLQILPSFIRKQGSMWGGGMAGLIIRLMFKILRAIKLRNKNYDYNSWRM